MRTLIAAIGLSLALAACGCGCAEPVVPPRPTITSLVWVEVDGHEYPLPHSAELTDAEYQDLMRIWAWVDEVARSYRH